MAPIAVTVSQVYTYLQTQVDYIKYLQLLYSNPISMKWFKKKKKSPGFKFWLCHLTSCVTLGELFKFFEPQVSHLSSGDNIQAYKTELCGGRR